MTRLVPLCLLLSACFHDPQINHDIALTTIGAAITAVGVFEYHVAGQRDDIGGADLLAGLLTIGGGIMTLVEAALLATDAAHGPRPE